MARAIQVGGHVGPVFAGLGEHVAQHSAGSAAAMRYGAHLNQHSNFEVHRAFPKTTWDLIHQQVPRSGSLVTPWPVNMKTCGGDGVPCMDGSPSASVQMGLAGLGEVTDFTCNDWAAAMNQLSVLLAEAESRSDASLEYGQAKAYFDSTSGLFSKPILPSTCNTETGKVTAFYNALASRLGVNSPLAPTSQNNTDAIATAAKWGAIALVALAGAYALGPIFRGIGGLIPSRKR